MFKHGHQNVEPYSPTVLYMPRLKADQLTADIAQSAAQDSGVAGGPSCSLRARGTTAEHGVAAIF